MKGRVYKAVYSVDVRSDMQIKERMHPRNNESGAGFQKDHREANGPVWACEER